MSWFDKLKQLVNIKNLKGTLLQINIYNHSNNTAATTQVLPPNPTGGHYVDEKNILHIDISALTPTQRKVLKENTKEYLNAGNRLLEHKTSDLFEELYNFQKNQTGSALLEFFESIIPAEDLEALEASLFLREKFKKDENISYLKKDIRSRFGDRGNNISNLCTAGYFEIFLMPLYNDSPEAFPKQYEDIVNNSMMALFVNHSTKTASIPEEIEKRIALAKKYGIKQFHIHGISKSNIVKIKKCIQNQSAFFKFFEKNIYENKAGDMIIVELILLK